jgi:hypothetical protein
MAISQIPSAGISSVSATTVSSGTLPYAQLPTGSVIQVVQNTYTSQTNTSSTSYVTTGRSASITPRFSNSKILVMVTAWMYNANSSSSWMTIYRNGSNIAPSDRNLGQLSTAQNSWIFTGFNYLDSPATTSALTYELYFKVANSSVYQGADNMQTSIQLLEIAG